MAQTSYVLASSSPRRKALIETLNRDFSYVSPEIDEEFDNEKSLEDAVVNIAKDKALAVQEKHPGCLVIGADTIVVESGIVLGKPQNENDVHRMLKQLSGKKHRVITGVAMVQGKQSNTFWSDAEVFFNPLSEAEIAEYIASGEPFNKAGAYAIQGLGAKFINRINGDYYAVMGLPVSKVYQHLKSYENGTLFSGCILR